MNVANIAGNAALGKGQDAGRFMQQRMCYVLRMIPKRFTIEYPERCAQLIAMLEYPARDMNLLGSFSVLAAAAAFTIPFQRIVERDHPAASPELKLFKAINDLGKKPFLRAPFWGAQEPSFFRYAKIVTKPNAPNEWKDAGGHHPIQSKDNAKNGNTVLRVIRNALAHGNIIYLNKDGLEVPGSVVQYLAFLTQHDDQVSYRVVIFDEESFLQFLKAWLEWLRSFKLSNDSIADRPPQ